MFGRVADFCDFACGLDVFIGLGWVYCGLCTRWWFDFWFGFWLMFILFIDIVFCMFDFRPADVWLGMCTVCWVCGVGGWCSGVVVWFWGWGCVGYLWVV